jgi:hypothetical protein
MKKIIILQNNNGRLANQLWLYASMYAYCLEKKYVCENPSFFRYNHYFNTPIPDSIARLFFSEKYLHKPKTLKGLYSTYSTMVKFLNNKNVVKDNDDTFILSPDIPSNKNQQVVLQKIDRSKNATFYFCGWLFRTPKGLEKYRKEIHKYFEPQEKYLKRITDLLKPLRDKYKHLVGVHIRHGDYKTWNGGRFYYTFSEVRAVLESYLVKYENPEDVIFIICSDDDIDDNVFTGLPYTKGLGTEIEDLYTLSQTNIIIGSNSSFGAWSAYYGNIPFIIFPEKTT